MKKRLFFLAVKRLTLVIILIVLILFVYFSYLFISPDSSLRRKFFGKVADYQGIIRLWNVDTFEGGCGSRQSFLNGVAARFEKENKGAYIMVENLALSELSSRIKNGEFPDMFSFGTGVGQTLKNKMKKLPSETQKLLMNKFYAAGLDGGELYAAPYAYGAYALISSSARIEAAGKEVAPLKEIALELSFDKVQKKSTKHIFSLTFGKGDYVGGVNVFSRSFEKNAILLAEDEILDKNYLSQTPYEAFLSFASGKSSVLLGTQRDIFRMENRLAAGKESDIICSPLDDYTDLVNFISITSDNKDIIKVSGDFICFLLSEKNQLKLNSVGLFSPCGYKLYDEGPLKEMEKYEIKTVCGAF